MSKIIPYCGGRARDIDNLRELVACFKFFIEINNISLFDTGFAYDPVYFIETGRREGIRYDVMPPHYDHVRLCKIKNGERFVIYCPYAQEGELLLDHEWAEKKGLYFCQFSKHMSLYGCGTTMVILSKTKLELAFRYRPPEYDKPIKKGIIRRVVM